jgi:histidinol-phosphate/aromatic aminotransferase/cobyric acid decarboxylase-like protein
MTQVSLPSRNDGSERGTDAKIAPRDLDREADEMALTQQIVDLCRMGVRGRAHVLDLGCGDGRRAVALASYGNQVTVIGSSSEALVRVREAAVATRVEVACLELDPLALDGAWPIEAVDVAISTLPEQWGPPNAYARVLRAVRRAMSMNGILVVHPHALHDDGVMYTPSILVSLLRSAGFEIEPVEQNPCPNDPRNVHPHATSIVARPTHTPPDSLALGSHQAFAQEPALNLRWSPDEAGFLAPTPEEIWAPMLADASRVATWARDYMLSDPWAGEQAEPALAAHFGVRFAPTQIAFGAGATSLLRHLALLARGGCVLTHPLVHPDLPLWAATEGARLAWMDDTLDRSCMRRAVATEGASLIHLDRPTAQGEIVPLDIVVDLCREAMARHAFVSIDESYLAYRPATASAASLTTTLDNLFVVRSLSKAYCCGGLRVGFAVAGTTAAAELRRLMSPLQVSTLAFRMALRLLEAGDIFGALRRRIAEAKAETIARLARDGHRILAGDAALPWVLIEDRNGRVQHDFAARGIAGKRLVPFSPRAGPEQGWLRLAVPLADERIAVFQRLMDAR